jgi:hypothetical protein
VVFAVEERKRGNPIFEHWHKGDEFNPEQTDWLETYWHGITSESLRNYDRWCVLKQNETAKDKQAAAWRLVWIKQIRTWNKKERKYEPTGLWKSGSDDDKGFSQGDAPANGKAGGVKAEETIRHTLGIIDPISPRPKTELLAELSRRSGMDLADVTERFNREWKNKSRNLFHHHGGGVWSTVHHKCAAKLKADELSELKDRAQEQRRRGKTRTERQEQFWTLFADLPKCEPNYDSPEDCPFWHHVQADPKRLEALQAIQANADSQKIREMSPAEYVAYLRENLRNFIRDDLQLPYFKDGRNRQGKLWYPRELFRNLTKCSIEEFRRLCERAKFSTEDFTKVVKRAAANGDINVSDVIEDIGYGYKSISGKTIEGASKVFERERQRAAEKVERDRMAAKMQAERERQEAVERVKREAEEAEEARIAPFLAEFRQQEFGSMVNFMRGWLTSKDLTLDKVRKDALPFIDYSKKKMDAIIQFAEERGFAPWKEKAA